MQLMHALTGYSLTNSLMNGESTGLMNSLGNQLIYRFKCLGEGERGKQTGFSKVVLFLLA